jgi:hypothetical protein
VKELLPRQTDATGATGAGRIPVVPPVTPRVIKQNVRQPYMNRGPAFFFLSLSRMLPRSTLGFAAFAVAEGRRGSVPTSVGPSTSSGPVDGNGTVLGSVAADAKLLNRRTTGS